MKKKLVLAACMAVFACACQPRTMQQNGNGNDQNFHDRRTQKPQGGCCETEKPAEKPSAPQQNQTAAATPEVKAETPK